MSINKLIDLVHRRTRELLPKYNVTRIYFANAASNVVYFFLDEDLAPEQLAAVRVHLIHTFEDYSDEFKVVVVPKTNHVIIHSNMYLIWKKGAGFIGKFK